MGERDAEGMCQEVAFFVGTDCNKDLANLISSVLLKVSTWYKLTSAFLY